jgi:hypothetical protein
LADFSISSLRGGLNNTDPAIALPSDQVVVAENVEWTRSTLGERRRGSDAIDLTGSDLAGCDRIVWLHRHLPTTDEADAQLWALGITDGSPSTATLAYKDTSWHTVSISDALTIDGVSEYQVQGQTLHGKLFIAYNSGVDRLHVWDGTSLRRTGLAEPAAPTGANQGSGSLAATARYYRVRYTAQSGGVTLRRSEPSEVYTITPSGTGSAVRITKPASISEGETHWELELSADNANFYVIATTVVGTTTVDDTQDLTTLASAGFTLSEDIGDYSLIPSIRYLTADQDRLMGGGSFEDEDLASRVVWTPVYNDPGDGNDERIPIDTDNFLNLDGFEGGPLTGLSATINGYVFGFKNSHIYKLVRTGFRTRAYDAIPLTKERGALEGSIVPGIDQSGNPALYFLDLAVGACRFGANGLEPCGADIWETWKTVNINAASIVSRGIYFPEHRQVHWWVATDDSDTPDTRIVLQTNETRSGDDGARRGWSIWTGPSAAALAVCLFSDNIDDDTDRNRTLKPFIALDGAGLIQRTDTGDDDNGTEYDARIVTKPYTHGNLLHQFECKNGVLLAKATDGATINITITPNFGADATHTKSVEAIDLSPAGAETSVIRPLDNLSLAELKALQIEFSDPDAPGSRWELEFFALREERGQRS